MGCPSDVNVVVYSDDSTVCKMTYNYSLGYGVYVLAKTIVIGGEIPVPEKMCISWGHWKNWINCCDVYSDIRVNGNIVLNNFASNAYETPGIVYPLQTGDVVTLYVNSFYTSAQSCVNNFRISRLKPPAANAGGPYDGTTNTDVTFDGSNSTDEDGTIVLYEWNFGDGHTDTGMIVTYIYDTTDIYTVVLTVTDNDGLIDTDTTSADISGFKVGDNVLLIPNYFDIYDRACIKGGDISVGDTVKTYPIKEGSRVAIKERWSLNDKITIRGSNT